MRKLIISIFLLFSVLLLQAEEPKKEIIVSQMTKAELNACYKNREKTDQRFLIKQNGYMGFIDGCGRVVIEPVYDSALEFSEGLARVEKNGKFGFIDKSGKVVIDFYLDFAWFFYEGKALAEIHGEKEEKFYIDKDNKRYPARYGENKEGKAVMFRKDFGDIVYRYIHGISAGNAFVLGKGLVSMKERKPRSYFEDYSRQRLSVNSVLKDELVETCENVKLLEKDGDMIFTKNGKALKTLDNFNIYEAPACRAGLTNILWLKKGGGEKTFFLYNLEGTEIASFESEDVIRRIVYIDKNRLGIAFYGGRKAEIFDLHGQKLHYAEPEKEHFALSEKFMDNIYLRDGRGEKTSFSERLIKEYCGAKLKNREGYVNHILTREVYDVKTGKVAVTAKSAYLSFRQYRSLNQGCLPVVRISETLYYLNSDLKVFWSGEIKKYKEDELQYETLDDIKKKLDDIEKELTE
ncbi:WG repeat-containing protein [bacterium]|nr:WG repeat-containing protein [bacterium]